MNFKEKTVLITGAAGTIGRAVATRFFKEGANLALVDYNFEALKAFAKKENFGDRVLLIGADVTNEQQVSDYVLRTVERFGTIDIFHNNAGVTGARAPITEIEIERFRALMNINVTGVLLGLKYVLRQMYKQGFGTVINTSSHKGKMCIAKSGDYAASKCAVIMLTKVAALEAAQYHVRVNCVMPGIVRSDMVIENWKKQDPGMTTKEVEKIYAASLPLGRWCEPSEVAEMVAFLASERASYLTGTELHLDGGTTASFM